MKNRFRQFLIFALLFAHASFCNLESAKASPPATTLKILEQKITVGQFRSRAILKVIDDSKLRPIVILIPGSGAHGPEEKMPSTITFDGRDHSLFEQFATALNLAGVHTLQLGKPGVEYFTGWDMTKWFYDKIVYQGLTWRNLLDNVQNAVDLALTMPGVDPRRIYVLGHSEGTQVAIDYAAQDTRLKGLLLLGYLGSDLATILDWQLYKREIEFFIATDVDSNRDGFVEKAEAMNWPEFRWNWRPDQDKVTYSEIETVLRADANKKSFIDMMRVAPLYANGIFHRGEIHTKTAALQQDVFVFNGSLDMQTPAREALELESKCKKIGKKNCVIQIIPGVGHGFSPPRPPKAQPVLDLTVGPANADFLQLLTEFAKRNF